MANNGRYVWFHEDDQTRNPYAAFRRRFTVRRVDQVRGATLCLFADTVYQLFVNGRFVGFGPVRFDPRHPQYDEYCLTPYLREGTNVIAVLVNFHGHKTFRNIPARAAMIAWGSVEDADGVTPLHTGTEWTCIRHAAYNAYSPKLSFALNARAHYDQAAFDEDWTLPDYDDAAWPRAVPLRDPSVFGPLTRREIPFMALTPVAPASVRVWPRLNVERLYSFTIALPQTYETAYDPQTGYSKCVAWATYVYSPCAQTVTAGVLYEPLWINGAPCEAVLEDPYRPQRNNRLLPLEAGWNALFCFTEAFQDVYDAYLALPEGRGLIVSADKNPAGAKLFRHTHILPREKDAQIRALPLPWPEDFDAEPLGGWVYTSEEDRAQNPCRETSWDLYGPAAQPLTPGGEAGFGAVSFRKDAYPDGFALLIELAHMHLLLPRLRLGGVRGATVDLLYGDRFTADGQHLRSLPWVPLGDRLICARDTIDWIPVQPRGFRYLCITVRNVQGDVTVDNIAFLSAQYPLTRVGRFASSDPVLTRIWEMGALTQSINMEDAFDDCVDRERGLYVLDTLIQYHVNLACYGDHALMKRALELYGQSAHETGLFRCVYPNTGHYIIPDFSLFVVDAFASYFRQTGDAACIAAYWPAIAGNLRAFARLSDERPDGLLLADTPAGDWPRAPVDCRTGFYGDGPRTDNKGVNCLFSCFYLIALRHAAAMAELVAPADVPALRARIAKLAVSIPEAFWDEARGLFADTMQKERFSPHASLLAVLAGVVSPERRAHLRENVPPLLTPFFKNGFDPSEGFAFSTNYALHMLGGLYELDLPETAERCMREGWGYFLTQGLVTTPEHFTLDASQCHAWSAIPTYMLSRYALGICPDAANGQGEVKINIRPGTLTWARGAYPHPKGEISIAWHKENGAVVIDCLSAPEGVRCTVTNHDE